MSVQRVLSAGSLSLLFAIASQAEEYHVSDSNGDDGGTGSRSAPFKTISAAAAVAWPGDVVTVHRGTYRERINPPRGGASGASRIVYQAAPGEKVVIKGSEVIKGWHKAENDTWTVTIRNDFFGDFNPYEDLVHGDWFNPKGRQHHTGAVYLDGHWLFEAARLEDVLAPAGENPLWFVESVPRYLVNVAWIQPINGAGEVRRIPAVGHAAQHGVRNASCSEGGECIGWIEDGDWVRYEDVDFGDGAECVAIRAASPVAGGRIELRVDAPDGELLGVCPVTETGDWQSWKSFKAEIKRTSGVKTLCLVFRSHAVEAPETTTLWAQFKGLDPNEADVAINVRQTVFYPEEPGRDYITVRGFTMMHAATPWSPPTAEQIGLIGTHWSKGWIIEDNDISYSTCVGVTLGKYGDEWDNRSQSADAYNRTIERALSNGWSKERIGHHIVRNNRISHCEQAGLVGSLGAVFSKITGNEIHDIHTRQLFTGAEMAGIKLHAPIDTVISGNRIYRANRGIWLDWMAQGTRVTRNLLHDNALDQDLYVEVNHGPFLVDHNIFLSGRQALLDMSEGGAYVHNLIVGEISARGELSGSTPYHLAHSTEVAGLRGIEGGDNRFRNNLVVGRAGLAEYDRAAQPVVMAGNVFLNGARPSEHERDPLVQTGFDPCVRLVEKADGVYLEITFDETWARERTRSLVTTASLGTAKTPDLPYEQPDGVPYRLDTDYFGARRDDQNPYPGPFERPEAAKQTIKVWSSQRHRPVR